MNIAKNIVTINENIKSAANRVKRSKDEIQLVAVSKTVDIDTIKIAQTQGIVDFGENYVQEFLGKQENSPELNWHFIGQLQSNKVKYIVNKVSLLHSMDRISLAKELSKRYMAAEQCLDVLVQVNIGNESQKGGVATSELKEFVDSVMELRGINITGLMCIHPLEEPKECRKYFSKMKNTFDKLKNSGYPMKNLSMGMSNDYVEAIEEGATIIRVGSAIFGQRTYK